MNADVNRYLTTWKVPDNKHPEKEKVALRRLASHTTLAGVSHQLVKGRTPISEVCYLADCTGKPYAHLILFDFDGTLIIKDLHADIDGKFEGPAVRPAACADRLRPDLQAAASGMKASLDLGSIRLRSTSCSHRVAVEAKACRMSSQLSASSARSLPRRHNATRSERDARGDTLSVAEGCYLQPTR